MTNSTERFTQNVENYLKYRPSYPPQVLTMLKEHCGLTQDAIVADIGSGTGLLAELILENGNDIYAVEPNNAMRQAEKIYLSGFPQIKYIDGRAEATTLADQSIDVITVGQAFHWFEHQLIKPEFKRILKPNGWVLLVWNIRATNSSALMQDYENLLLKYGIDYPNVSAKSVDGKFIDEFFQPNKVNTQVIPHKQEFDYNSFQGRVLSTSYLPKPDQENYQSMLAELHNVFQQHQVKGKVDFLYETKIYCSQL